MAHDGFGPPSHYDLDAALPPVAAYVQQARPTIPLLNVLQRNREAKRVVAFMLPGGGAHGCFGAAVLATLLTHPDFSRVEIAASVGASAGAINGAIATSALQKTKLTEAQRRREAAHRLDDFWQKNVVGNFAMAGFYNAMQATSLYLGQMWDRNKPNWVPEGTLNGQYITRFLQPLVEAHFDPLTRSKKNLPQLFVGTSKIVGRDQYEPSVHGNEAVDPGVLMASGGLVDIFGARRLKDGHWHADGAYTANPSEEPLRHMKTVTDVIWIMNDPVDRPISKSSKLKSAWQQIAPYRALTEGPRHHSINLERHLPEFTRILPTSKQNDTLWADGVRAAHSFLRSEWPAVRYSVP